MVSYHNFIVCESDCYLFSKFSTLVFNFLIAEKVFYFKCFSAQLVFMFIPTVYWFISLILMINQHW